MNDLTTTPTADLIAEWKRTHTYDFPSDWEDSKMVPIEKLNGRVIMTSLGDVRAKDAPYAKIKATIATELDRRADNAGIWIGDGLPTFTKFDDYEIPQPEKDYLPHLESVTLDIQPTELHALLGWLILKEGGNNG